MKNDAQHYKLQKSVQLIIELQSLISKYKGETSLLLIEG